MNYKKVYDDLMQKRILNPLIKSDSVYTENHHIIPKFAGGTDDSSNIIRLTMREHYIAHILLVKYYKQLLEEHPHSDRTLYIKSVWAFSAVSSLWDNKSRLLSEKTNIINYNSRLYAQLKEEIVRAYSENNKKKWENLDEKIKREICKKISKSLKEYNKTHKNIWSGRHHKESTKKLIAEKLSIAQEGEKNSQFGTLWISNSKEKTSKKILKEEFEQYNKNGWFKGRVVDWDCFLRKEELVREILEINPKSTVTVFYNEGILKSILDKRKRFLKEKKDFINLHSEMIKEYRQMSWDLLKEKYNYQFSRANFIQNCKRLQLM